VSGGVVAAGEVVVVVQQHDLGERGPVAAADCFDDALVDADAVPQQADEAAAAVTFLAREDSGFITGQILSVNGGSSMI
jgi:NAD(P)-dependent dehydrogenase (short-subunit alcohol dehydrogenase family)